MATPIAVQKRHAGSLSFQVGDCLNEELLSGLSVDKVVEKLGRHLTSLSQSQCASAITGNSGPENCCAAIRQACAAVGGCYK
ncbi:hypothetical protein HK097_005830 [Rhizophlyctis rosea]|uniref:Uncharacterized protein n=1 Tax=Rhizophlyctis rosea TaxID=64517 RepID=A0AAD5X5Z0_9FUNG|nr:hypothetical protein HK097_005830 [Rhizophlyctis rosea]